MGGEWVDEKQKSTNEMRVTIVMFGSNNVIGTLEDFHIFT